MGYPPSFPDFKEITIDDRRAVLDVLEAYQPETSEWTFTNLFIWRYAYRFKWSMYRDWLIVIASDEKGELYALPPIGPHGRRAIVATLLEWLLKEKGALKPRIEKADERLILEVIEAKALAIEPMRDHFDYLYRRDDLVALSGNRFRSKRNHINQFLRNFQAVYMPLNEGYIIDCLELQDKWCRIKRCEDDLSLLDEWDAIHEILENYPYLGVKGGVILIDERVVAFTIGELLNRDTAVIHIEKADPEIPGLYQYINQQFCEMAWEGISYINREQDLGLEGLRRAKLSYWPDRLVKKWLITPKGI